MFVCPTCHERYDESRTVCPADGSKLVAAPVTEPAFRNATPRDAPTNRGRPAGRMASPPPAGGAVSAAAVSVALNAEIEAGDVIGEYHVTGRIGEGGMGTVFAGIHPVIGKKVAIKVLNAALSHDQEIVDRFAQEARRRRCRPRTGSSTGSRALGASLRAEHVSPGSHMVPVEAEHYLPFERPAATSHRLGSVVGGSEGRSTLEAAEAWMRAESIRAPAKLAALFAP